MKVKAEHYGVMLAALAPWVEQLRAHRVNLAARKDKENIKDVDMRLRWDAMYAAGLTGFACKHLYSYCNDTHIDTALRSIMKELSV